MYCKSCGAAVVGKYCSCCGARVRTDAEELRLIENRMRREFVSEMRGPRALGRLGLAYANIAEACWLAADLMHPRDGMTVEAGREALEEVVKYARWVFSMVIVAVRDERRNTKCQRTF